MRQAHEIELTNINADHKKKFLEIKKEMEQSETALHEQAKLYKEKLAQQMEQKLNQLVEEEVLKIHKAKKSLEENCREEGWQPSGSPADQAKNLSHEQKLIKNLEQQVEQLERQLEVAEKAKKHEMIEKHNAI